MKTLFFTIAATLVNATACATYKPAKSLEIQTHTAKDSGFVVNSHLILGQKEAILIDSQFTREEAGKVVEMIKNSGRKLKEIYITHGHPDHYFGLEILSKNFPTARILARKKVIEVIKETGPGKLSYWKGLYGDALTDKIVMPIAFEGDSLTLDGQKIQILNLGAGESGHDTAIYIPQSKSLISGDAVYSKVHLWLAEERPENWMANLIDLNKLEVNKVYPGHGPVGDKNLLTVNMKYIQDFKKSLIESNDLTEVKGEMISKYPDYQLPIILELSLQEFLK